MKSVRRFTVAVAMAVGLVCSSAAFAAAEPAPQGNGSIGRTADPIAGQYVVTLNTDNGSTVPAVADALAQRHDGEVLDVYEHALRGFSVRMSEANAASLAADPAVASVTEDGVVTTQTVQAPAPSWGIDRVDEPDLPLDNQYAYAGAGVGVHAYVIDSGVLTTHTDFGGRASVGVDEVGGPLCDPATQTKSGHGTHVAGTIGGTTYGIAKGATIVSVRVLNCNGSGAYSQVIAGVDWVTANAIKPAVANMSLGGSVYQPLDDAVAESIASGVTYAVAAGNSSTNVCTSSPADVTSVLTVGATTSADSRDTSYSNFGSCVDLFAPGTAITSDWNTSDTATNVNSGTSMATPHVAGVAARYLAANPCASPAEVATALEGNATTNHLANIGTGSPNLLLYSGFLGPDVPIANPCPPTLSLTAGYNSVHLGWSTPGGGTTPVTGYAIYRSTSPGGEGGVPLATASGAGTNSYDDATALGGTTYYYQVAAINDSGETRSAEQSVTPLTPSAPDAPTLLVAGGNGHVALGWNIPAANGSPITGFEVKRGTTTGGETSLVSLGAGVTFYDDAAVTNGTPYFYTVTATNGVGSTASAEQTATPRTSNGAFFPLTPARILDSRTGNGTPLTPFTGGAPRTLQVTGRGQVPASGVSAVVMNVTVTNPTVASHVTVWPGSVSMPTASNLNFVPGETEPNLVTVGVSASGTVKLALDDGSADLIADVVGYYGDGTGGGGSGARYQPLAPSRILDSRSGPGYTTPWGPGVTRDLTLTGVPVGATAVVLNVTATNPTAAGFATVWPSGLTRPDPASNLNFVSGQTVPNLVTAPIGANGKVSLYNSAGTTDFIADLVGYYGAGATALFTPVTPTRLLDSRYGPGFTTPWGSGQTRDLTVGGAGPVPTDASAVVTNVTVTNPTVAGHAIVWPSGGSAPVVSNLNFVPGETVPNLVIVQIGGNKKVSFFNSAGSTDMIADVVGYFR